jgi:hypothetical protein
VLRKVLVVSNRRQIAVFLPFGPFRVEFVEFFPRFPIPGFRQSLGSGIFRRQIAFEGIVLVPVGIADSQQRIHVVKVFFHVRDHLPGFHDQLVGRVNVFFALLLLGEFRTRKGIPIIRCREADGVFASELVDFRLLFHARFDFPGGHERALRGFDIGIRFLFGTFQGDQVPIDLFLGNVQFGRRSPVFLDFVIQPGGIQGDFGLFQGDFQIGGVQVGYDGSFFDRVSFFPLELLDDSGVREIEVQFVF